MPKYSKFNIVYRLQKWMDSVAGQTFMNYAYSWGAAVVILGTLFKLTHLPGANLMLFIGMGTEVFVFFISAFDRPFDKTTDGMDLATDTQLAAEAAAEAMESGAGAEDGPVVVGGGVVGGGVIGGGVIGGGIIGGAPVIGGSEIAAGETEKTIVGNVEGAAVAGNTEGSTIIIGGSVPPTPAPAVSPETAEAMEEATSTYVERLNTLNDTLVKVTELSEKLSADSVEMENLCRTLTSIARVYEMQLKAATLQMSTQEDINARSKEMAQQIAELNSIYTRMIEAMTVNMPKVG